MRWLLRKIKFYIFINSFICTIAALTSSIGDSSLFGMYSSVLLRIFLVLAWFEWISSFKSVIYGSKRNKLTSAQNYSIIVRLLLIVGPTEVISWYVGKNKVNELQYWSYLEEYVYFIPKSLAFELIFDFFHYIAHWICHQIPSLYKHVHKRHHLHLHPTPLSTYEQDGIDLCLTNVMPMSMAFLLGPTLSPLQLHLMLAYKTYVEIAGHSGLEIKGFSFPQMPLMSIFSICLRVHDHDLHHTHPTYNFAKRFSVWDKLFGTFQAARFNQAASY
ncbi:hypothetical protein THRCLA_09038 [Thraustotheca clavata]|uniref:Fatty acid hydroxylase domain-containing protein n=1 Tax=Thraustotheca clavata TaxID=74557 RepID=A0A1V9Z050_9STRA|nr:hypothetical protein THRCLA_09038 [Thraustotheca clavata]